MPAAVERIAASGTHNTTSSGRSLSQIDAAIAQPGGDRPADAPAAHDPDAFEHGSL